MNKQYISLTKSMYVKRIYGYILNVLSSCQEIEPSVELK